MKYICLIYSSEVEDAKMSPEEQQADFAAYMDYNQIIEKAGISTNLGEALQPTATATTVRIRDGKTVASDGPFAETKEQLGGFYILDCKDLDQAIEYAAMIPAAKHGSVEVRPILEINFD
ncbi:MAG: YciI family protein [Chloroflexota bacterium]